MTLKAKKIIINKKVAITVDGPKNEKEKNCTYSYIDSFPIYTAHLYWGPIYYFFFKYKMCQMGIQFLDTNRPCIGLLSRIWDWGNGDNNDQGEYFQPSLKREQRD